MGRRIIWQLYPSYILLILAALVIVIWYASDSVESLYLQRTAADLQSRAHLIEDQVTDLILRGEDATIDSLSKELGPKSETRITVIRPDGAVLGDSDEDPAIMDNHASRPEVVEALEDGTGVSTRYSQTVKQKMMYFAATLKRDGKLVGVLRMSLPVKLVDEVLTSLARRIALGGLVVVLLAAVISLIITRRISRPIEELRLGAERFAEGDLSYHLPVPATEEVGALAEAMNKMAAQLDDRLKMVIRQRNEKEAILASMVEGVLAVDTDGRLLNMNAAAEEILGLEPGRVSGRQLSQVVPHRDLHELVEEVLQSRERVERSVTLGDADEQRYLQAHGTLLIDSQGRSIGALVVLNDITRLTRLENVRREFVANVSHELKTPITAIKGFVETLLDGAMNSPDDASRFLKIVADKVDHLTEIIEDLLRLSRIEQDADQDQISLRCDSIVDVLEAAIETCTVRAKAEGVTLRMECDDDLSTHLNRPLLEQGVVNLIDNAIKFSESGDEVVVSAAHADGFVTIAVEDKGAGIPPEHLPRLFERFYRVDKGRSRQLGGSGLGLAITKHIAKAHKGDVSVESEQGVGSTFRIIIPQSGDSPDSANAGE